jgi:hypothetical protein
MARKTKLWGGLVLCHSNSKLFGHDCEIRQHRCLVKATSQKRACELIEEHFPCRMNVNALRNYWGLTGNSTELAVAETAEVEGLWVVIGPRHNLKTVDQYRRLV